VAADTADCAALVRGILRLAAARDKAGMCKLAAAQRDPDILGGALVLLGAELAAMRLDVLAGALMRFESAPGALAARNGG
jgi:hypothetical protein